MPRQLSPVVKPTSKGSRPHDFPSYHQCRAASPNRESLSNAVQSWSPVNDSRWNEHTSIQTERGDPGRCCDKRGRYFTDWRAFQVDVQMESPVWPVFPGSSFLQRCVLADQSVSSQLLRRVLQKTFCVETRRNSALYADRRLSQATGSEDDLPSRNRASAFEAP